MQPQKIDISNIFKALIETTLQPFEDNEPFDTIRGSDEIAMSTPMRDEIGIALGFAIDASAQEEVIEITERNGQSYTGSHVLTDLQKSAIKNINDYMASLTNDEKSALCINASEVMEALIGIPTGDGSPAVIFNNAPTGGIGSYFAVALTHILGDREFDPINCSNILHEKLDVRKKGRGYGLHRDMFDVQGFLCQERGDNPAPTVLISAPEILEKMAEILLIQERGEVGKKDYHNEHPFIETGITTDLTSRSQTIDSTNYQKYYTGFLKYLADCSNTSFDAQSIQERTQALKEQLLRDYVVIYNSELGTSLPIIYDNPAYEDGSVSVPYFFSKEFSRSLIYPEGFNEVYLSFEQEKDIAEIKALYKTATELLYHKKGQNVFLEKGQILLFNGKMIEHAKGHALIQKESPENARKMDIIGVNLVRHWPDNTSGLDSAPASHIRAEIGTIRPLKLKPTEHSITD